MPQKNYLLNKDEILALGASLREIEPSLLKKCQQPGITRMWFQGEEPYLDVFFELKDDQILWFQFTLRGKSVSWDYQKGQLQSGTTNELNCNDVSFYAASKTIENDIKPNWDLITLVKLILQTRIDVPIFAKALELFN
ncbi:hypothetical protein H6G04_14885 [Calothrix membranacea FACHB-236]|nr:hypothetical protein [Calothrix membranacea FACHB-236]